MGKTKLCCIFNTPSLYRELIYKRIEETYDCDWYFEDTDNKLKEFNTNRLKRVERQHTYNIGPFYGVQGLVALLKKKEYNQYLMMGHSRNLSTLAFLLLKRFFYPKKRAYLWTHGFYGKESRFETIWKRILLGSADKLFVYGDYACKIMREKYGFDKANLYPIHNSLEYDVQLRLRSEMASSPVYFEHFKNHCPTMLFIGRLNPWKKLEMAIQAVADLRDEGEFYNLVLVGDGSARADLEMLAQRLGVNDHIWFYGACYDEKTNAELIYNADLCVAPGNIGLTSIHVLMFGCPAISHNDFAYQMPEFEAIKDGETGSFFERDSQQSLNAAISKWFTRKDYNREAIRQACYNEIDTNWNPDYQMNIIKEVIQ